MSGKNVPMIDGRYWAAVVVASILGTSLGDFVSNTLELGFGPASLAVGSLLAFVFIAERVLPWKSIAWYWGAVVFLRTAATCIGDFLTRTTGWGNGPVSAIVAALLAVYLIGLWLAFGCELSLNGGIKGAPKHLPKTNLRYWSTMLVVSVLGTALGDFVSDDMGFGLRNGAIITGGTLALFLAYEMLSSASNEIRYWLLIAAVRTAGTVIADYLTEEDGLNLGFGVVAATAACILLAITFAPRKAMLQPNVSIGPAEETGLP